MGAIIQNIIIIIGLIAVIVLGYVMYTENNRNQLNFTSTSALQDEVIEFIQKQQELDSIVIDTSILQDSNFRSLQEVVGPPPQLEVGRDNPFIPN